MLYPRPFLKWAGGKTRLLNILLWFSPQTFEIYHEPFLGGGSLFFGLYRNRKIKKAIISDINAELIDTYLAIRDNVNEVIRLLQSFPYNKEFYYFMREQDPWQLSLPERAARMIYLNKTGYNGLYRVNRKGKFNVPFGRYKAPKYFDRENLIAVAQSLQDVEILCTSFETVLERAAPGDFVYLDPPYIPLTQTANFTSYHANGFGPSDQERLRDVCVALSERKVYVMLSNSNTKMVRSLYGLEHFSIEEVLANRAINCDKNKRGKISELIITNYHYK
ncbi:MAG: DNA adenine methylase [Candidatus Aenigmatarchaeota archaeon]